MSVRLPSVPSWDGVALVVSQDRALLTPAACRLLLRCLEVYARVEGLPISAPPLRTLRQVLATVANPASGHADVRDDSGPGWSVHEEITSDTAAQLLGCSPRHVRRLAAEGQLGATRRRNGNRLLLQHGDVVMYRTEKRTPA